MFLQVLLITPLILFLWEVFLSEIGYEKHDNIPDSDEDKPPLTPPQANDNANDNDNAAWYYSKKGDAL